MAMVALSDPFVRLSSDVLYMLDDVSVAVVRGTRKIAREKLIYEEGEMKKR